MTLHRRVCHLEAAALRTVPRDWFSVVVAVPFGSAEAGDRPLGLHRDGPEGSTAGVFVSDPAGGEPEVPAERLAPWARVIIADIGSEGGGR